MKSKTYPNLVISTIPDKGSYKITRDKDKTKKYVGKLLDFNKNTILDIKTDYPSYKIERDKNFRR